MKKNFKKLIIAAAAASVLMACGSTVKSAETEKSMTESNMPESIEANSAGMTEDMSSDMSEEMPNLPGVENGKVKSVTENTIRIERIAYVGNEEASTDNSEGQNGEDDVDLILDPSGVNFVDMATGKVSEAPKEGDEIYAWVAPEYMTSMPPQVNSYVIMTNVKGGLHMPMYTDGIENIGEADGNVELLDTTNNAKWSFDKSVKPVLSSTGEEVEFTEIKKGDKCLIWSDNFMITSTSKEPTKIKASSLVILK